MGLLISLSVWVRPDGSTVPPFGFLDGEGASELASYRWAPGADDYRYCRNAPDIIIHATPAKVIPIADHPRFSTIESTGREL